MRTSLGRTRVAMALVGASALALSACSDDGEPESSVPVATEAPTTDLPTESTLPSETDLPDDVTASGVVLAATLIAAGNIEDAVASGLVTPAEVDEARAAIESGTLDRWVALAEGR